MPAPASRVPRIGRFLVELERLERAQRPGVFLVDHLQATQHGVVLKHPSGSLITLSVDSTSTTIGESLRAFTPDLQIPLPDAKTDISDEPTVQTQWAQLHYALGAYDTAILLDAHVRVLAAERHGSAATVQILRGPHDTIETYTLDLDRPIDIGLADTLAFAPGYGTIGGTLNWP